MSATTLTDDGCWCWFQDPRAVRHVGDRDRTYVGWITRGGDVQVASYDAATESTRTTTLHAGFERDDHDAPALAIRPDGRILVFYTRHGADAVLYRRSENPEDVDAFGPERRIEPGGPDRSITYPNPRWIGDDLYLFLRNDEEGEGKVVVVESSDGGDTWSDQRPLVTTGGEGWCVYHKVSRGRDGEVHLGLTHAFGGANDPHRHVTHARFDGTVLRGSDGSELGRVEAGSLPVEVSDTTTVYDSAARNNDAWIWDCSTAGGRAQLVFAELVSDTDHRYRYARYDDGAWEDELVCHGGSHIVAGEDNAERYYSGGVALDHDVPGVCYASAGSHDSSTLDRYERTADGWQVTRVAVPDDQNVRPVVPWNRRHDRSVCWARGEYTHFAPYFSQDADAAYHTAIVGTVDRDGPADGSVQ